uniref:Ribonuclease A-domain domain-containing protein n=1 Tax=Sander lucioperca TaxID=283035 RepID=A0A8D0D6P5_SANLU
MCVCVPVCVCMCVSISIFAGVLLISAALMFLGPETADATFANRHINPGMTPGQCTDVMNRRNIRDGNKCKPLNTFIDGSLEEVSANCGNGRNKFDVILCNLTKETRNRCIYDGAEYYGIPVVKCDANNNPYHLDRVIYTIPPQ